MEQSQPPLGGLPSVDVEMWLMSLNGEKYGKIPLHLHSVILQRWEFFKAKKWSSESESDRDPERVIRITSAHNYDGYITFLEFINGDQTNFDNVRQCLAVVCVASELMLAGDDLIKKCMQYLQEACLSAEQKTQIRNVVSSLGLKVLPEFAEKLDDAMYEEKMIKRMLSLVKDKNGISKNRENAERYLTSIFKGEKGKDAVEICKQVLFQEFKKPSSGGIFKRLCNVLSWGSKAVPDDKEEGRGDIICEEKEVIREMLSLVKDKHATTEIRNMAKTYIREILKGGDAGNVCECERVILQEFESSIRSRKISALKLLTSLILRDGCNWDRKIKRDAYIAFCGNPKFTKYVSEWPWSVRSAENLCAIVTWFMEALGREEIISITDSQICTLLTTWLPIVAKLFYLESRNMNMAGGVNTVHLDKAALVLAERLPHHDRKLIREVWTQAYTKHNFDITRVLTLS